ncbi:MAG TPA: SRPBCC family protein [Motilibacteraceae bacterium]|nr:SRPBCC family protein [Motilibacteraceae bacterium]
MPGDAPTEVRLLGTLHEVDGAGAVRFEDRLAATADEVWSVLTDPARLAQWLGTVDGELRPGGELRAHWHASGWEGTVRIETCEPPHRLLVRTAAEDEPDGTVELTLTPDGAHTQLVVEDRGLPPAHLAAYAAGNQIHLEDLAAHLAGCGRCDPRTRFGQLHAAYQAHR